MKKFVSIAILMLVFAYPAKAQKEYFNWIFGDGASISFDTPNLEPEYAGNYYFAVIDGRTSTKENTSVISDYDGQLLLYSSDRHLYDFDQTLFEQGEKLDGHYSSTQGSIILNIEEDEYIRIGASGVLENENTSNEKVLSFVNIKRNFNKFIVSDKKVILDQYIGEKLLVFRNDCSDSFLLLVFNKEDGFYYSYKYDYRINEFELISKIQTRNNNYENSLGGYLKSDLKGNTIVSMFAGQGLAEILRYDCQSGELNSTELINFDILNMDSYSGEFSPNGENFYFLGINEGIYVIKNLHTEISSDTQINLVVDDVQTNDKYTLLMGPNGKIYISNNDKSYLSELSNTNNPDNVVFTEEAIQMVRKSYIGLPNIPTTFYNVSVSEYISICEGEDITLKIPERELFNNAEYQWSGPNGFTSNKKLEIIEDATANQSGKYICRITVNEMVYIVELIVTVNPEPQFNITANPGAFICDSSSAKLSVPSEFTNAIWSNGEESSEISINKSGIYSVNVIDTNGCQGYAEIEIIFGNDISLNILGPEQICPGNSAVLSADTDFDSYLWSTGETTKEIEVSSEGEYWVVGETESGCITSDTLNLSYFPEVDASLKQVPNTICSGDTVILEPENINSSYSYLWNTGETNESIEVYEAGTYKLIVTDTETGCLDSSEISIEINNNIDPIITGPSSICENGDAITLNAEPSGADYEYIWNTGETSQKITVSQSGTYSVTVTKDNCTGIAEKEVIENPEPDFSILGNNFFCEGETTTLSSSEDYEEYLWSTGETTKEIEVSSEGTYYLTVTDENGCFATKFLNVKEYVFDYTLTKQSMEFGKVYISETKTDRVEFVNTSEDTLIIDGIVALLPGQKYELIHTVDPEETGLYTRTLTINITGPCPETITIDVSAEVYARVTLKAPEIKTQVGATEVELPITMSAETDLINNEYEYTVETIVNDEIYFTENDLTFTNTSFINANETEVHSYSGMVLLARQLTYPIRFGEVSFNNPFIEVETIEGKIEVDSVCIHNSRVISLQNAIEVTVNPNPAVDDINIDITAQKEGIIKIELISSTGASIYRTSLNHRSGSNTLQIPIDNLPSGLYQVIVTSYGQIYRKEIVVAR